MCLEGLPVLLTFWLYFEELYDSALCFATVLSSSMGLVAI